MMTHNVEVLAEGVNLAGEELDPRINFESRMEPVGETQQFPLA